MAKGWPADFKAFAARGSMVDLAIGLVLGLAFAAVVKSFVDDVLMPPIGLALGGVDSSNLSVTLKPGTTAATTLAQAKAAGAVTLNYGLFLNTIIQFLIIALAIYLVIKALQRTHVYEASTESCPYCLSNIPSAAVKCSACTADLTPAAPIDINRTA